MTRRYETVYIFDSALDEPAITEKLTRFHALLTKDGKAVPVPVHGSRDLGAGLVAALQRQSGVKLK